MKITNLMENHNPNGEEMVNDLIENVLPECEPFLKEINYDPHFISLRDLDGMNLDEYYGKLETKEKRYSMGTNYLLSKILNKCFKENNIPSRIEHATFSSSLGKNTLIRMSSDSSYYCLPVGNFTYSFIENDFNDSRYNYAVDAFREFKNTAQETLKNFFDKTLEDEISDLDLFLDREKYEDHINKIFYDLQINNNPKAEELLTKIIGDYLDEYDNFMNSIDMLIKELPKSNNIHEAFSKEHEIWFNCKEYYLVSKEVYPSLKEAIRRYKAL